MGDIIGFVNNKINKREVLSALKLVSDFCAEQLQEDCDRGKCPIFKWCKVSRDREEFPCNWRINI